jgi:hypothetical protein
MVDADAVDQALRVQIKYLTMRGVENAREFDAQPRKRVDIEKPPPINFIGRSPPPDETIILTFKKFVKTTLTLGAICRKA